MCVMWGGVKLGGDKIPSPYPWRLLFEKPTGTQYPSNLAMAATWDESLVYEYAKSIYVVVRMNKLYLQHVYGTR